jgi:hypothetical protein
MAGAFTAVADEASAIYWNPAGQATGDYLSLVVGRGTHESGAEVDDPEGPAVRGSGTLVAFAVPVVGVGYYRLDQAWVGPAVAQSSSLPASVHRRASGSLVTDQFAVSLAQTLVEGLHVGVALKAVRGRAVDVVWIDEARNGYDARGTLEHLSDLSGPAETSFDADVGVMVDLRRWRLGLSARNLLEPEFRTDLFPDGARVNLERAVRVGVAALPGTRVTLALDVDLTTSERADGRWRALAVGGEAWTRARRLGLRGGLRMQTVGGARPVGTVGVSAQVWKLLYADVHGALGADDGREWSVGARVAY